MKENRSTKILVCTLLFGLFIGITTTGVLADGTETLGKPSIDIASGSGVIAKGVGLVTQPGNINIDIPSGTKVKQVLLYWEGQHKSANGDNTIDINGKIVTGKPIGGPTHFFSGVKSSTYRVDITSLALIKTGPNNLVLKGLTFDYRNNGAGIIVIYEKGALTNIQIRDGNDLAYYKFSAPIDTTVTQIFNFEPSTIDRVADISMFFSSIFVEENQFRPNVIEIKVGDKTTELVDLLKSNDGQEWDTLVVPVKIPKGITSLSIKALSKNKGTSNGDPASLTWNLVSVSLPKEIKILKGRMTGGGSVFKGDMRVTHGFEIKCNQNKPNNLEVNWPGNKFQMKDLTYAVCTDDTSISPKPPNAPFDTFTGKGNGKLNGVNGARIEFVFTDAGEPGINDSATMKIWDKSNKLVLEVSGLLEKGNHQAHK